MDAYADAMIARGPTLAPDGESATGSMHMVDLPDAEAARVFAFEEPNYRAGVYDDVLIRRWRNVLGRTMWEFEGDPVRNRRFLIIGHGASDGAERRDPFRDERRRHLDRHRDAFIARGPLLADDGETWLGTAALVERPDRAALDAMLTDDPYVRAELYTSVEIHDWRFGGR